MKRGYYNADYLTAGSYPTPSGSDKFASDLGITYNHAYTILKVVKLSNEVRLVQMRNPWGHELYHGPWSDDSELWTDETKLEAGWVDKDDGMFFMDLDTYLSQFYMTIINKHTDTMHRSHFLMFNDTSEYKGRLPWCGSDCSLHEFFLTSEIEQTVYISAHTWPQRSYPAECTDYSNSYDSLNLMWVSGNEQVYGWHHGSTDIEPLTIRPG